MIEFIDTHTHLFVEEFDGDREAVVKRAVEAGVATLCLPCIDENSLEPLLAMCAEFPGVCHPMIGLHPTELGSDYKEVLERMHARVLSDNRFVAIGEVGLDFYWDETFRKEQMEAFCMQLDWAVETGLPLAIHSRSAFNELYEIMESYRCHNLKGVFHCFSGSSEEAEKLLSFDGFCLGVGGVLTYKKSALPAVLANIPLERVLLETDSPYLSPVPYRGKRNESAYVPFVAAAMAAVYGCSLEHVADVTTSNARRLFTKIAK